MIQLFHFWVFNLENTKPVIGIDIYTHMYITAWFIIVKI